MTRARDFADLAGSVDAGGISGRNLFINGANLVAQRGTTVTDVGIDDYSLDRWKQWASSGSETGRSTVTQETITDLAGFSTAMKIQVTTADTSLGSTDALAMLQRIEAQDVLRFGIGTANSKTLTLSVYAKAPTGNGTYCMGICMPGGGHYVKEVTVGTSWSRLEVNIPATTTSSHATTATGTANGLQAFIALCTGSGRNTATNGVWGDGANIKGTTNQTNFYASTSNNLWLTGWQLEAGEKATPFEHRSFEDELERCKRYFQQIGSGYGKASSTSAFDCSVTFNPPMRANPTVSNNGTVIQITNITSADHNQSSASCADTDSGVTDGTYGGGRVRFSNFSGLTSGTTYAIDHTGSQGGAATFDAEL